MPDRPVKYHSLLTPHLEVLRGFSPNLFDDKNIYDWIEVVDQSKEYSAEMQLWVAALDDISFKKYQSQLEYYAGKNYTLVVIDQGLSLGSILELINQYQVYYVIKEKKQIHDSLMLAIEHSLSRRKFRIDLQQVKIQNKKLESLNENLEGLVMDRTRHQFESAQQTEKALKSMQSIFSFIKMVAACDSIEDLMNEVRGEYKKFHSVMPPVLILMRGEYEIQVFYFQGKQFTQKRIFDSKMVKKVNRLQDSEFRSFMSEVLSRPFGVVTTYTFDFTSHEKQSVSARLIFENSLNSKDLQEFQQANEERWPIISRAIETLLIKEAMQSTAKQWSRTFNQIKDPILIINENYQMTLSNQEFHKKSDRHCHQALAGQTVPCIGCPIEKTFQAGTPQTSDLHVKGRYLRVHSYPIRLADQEKVTHVINQYVDITPTVSLRSRVIQSEKMAAVGLLAGNIAHELNNPLTGIHSLAQLLLVDLNPDSNTYKDLSEIKDAALRCQRIIRDLLDFTSVGSDSRTKVIEVNELVSKTLPLLKMAMRTLNADVQLSSEKIWVECNPQLLQQVIFNLVNNACQAMEDGGRLIVRTEQKEGEVHIIVRDTGPGVPEEIRPFIFEPFFTTKEEGKGTGLGLSMSQSVIERYKGRLLLNNDYKEGSEFNVILPVVVK